MEAELGLGAKQPSEAEETPRPAGEVALRFRPTPLVWLALLIFAATVRLLPALAAGLDL